MAPVVTFHFVTTIKTFMPARVMIRKNLGVKLKTVVLDFVNCSTTVEKVDSAC